MTFYQKNKAPKQPTKFCTSSQHQSHHVQQQEQVMGGMIPDDQHGTTGFNGEVQLTMYIPAEMSGKVIGVKGIIISNITRETQCRFIKAMQPVGDSLWCAIVMMGEPDRCLVAYQAIAKMVFREVDDVVLTFYFNRKKHSFLMEMSGFHVIKRISAETQVRIFVPDASVPGMNMRDVFPGQPSFASLEGPCMNVFRALDKLKEAHILSVEIEKQTQKLMVLQQQQQQLQQMAMEEAENKAAAAQWTRGSTLNNSNNNNNNPTSARPLKTKGQLVAPGTAPSSSLPIAQPLPTKKTQKQLLKDGVDTTASPSLGAAATANDPSQSTLTPKQQAAAAKKAAKLLLREQLKAAGVPFPDDPVPSGDGGEVLQGQHPDGKNAMVLAPPVTAVRKEITLPTYLVGLLLARRPAGGARPQNVMNQIQRYTFTIISRMKANGKLKIKKGEEGEGKDDGDDEEMGGKVGGLAEDEEGGKEKGKGKTPRRRRMEDDDDSDESDHGSRFRKMEMDSDDDEDEEEEEEEEDDFQDAIEGDAGVHEDDDEETEDKEDNVVACEDDVGVTTATTVIDSSGDDSEIPLASAFHHWRATTSPVTSPHVSPTKSSSEMHDDQGLLSKTSSAGPSGPPSRRASIEQVVDDVLAKAIEAVVTATGTQVKAGVLSRRRESVMGARQHGGEEEEGEGEEGEGEGEGEEGEEGGGEEGEEKEEGEEGSKLSKKKKMLLKEADRDSTPVPFIVCGPYQENIDAALLALDTIVAGQRIKDVLAQMRSTCAHLKRPCWTSGGGIKDGVLVPHSARNDHVSGPGLGKAQGPGLGERGGRGGRGAGRGVGVGGRGGGGRGVALSGGRGRGGGKGHSGEGEEDGLAQGERGESASTTGKKALKKQFLTASKLSKKANKANATQAVAEGVAVAVATIVE